MGKLKEVKREKQRLLEEVNNLNSNGGGYKKDKLLEISNALDRVICKFNNIKEELK